MVFRRGEGNGVHGGGIMGVPPLAGCTGILLRDGVDILLVRGGAARRGRERRPGTLSGGSLLNNAVADHSGNSGT